LILANNDIFIEETDTLTLMIEAAEGFKMLHHDFLMGAKINSYYHRDQVLSRGLLFFPFKHSYKQSSLRKKKDLEFFNKKISYIDYPEGSFLLISKGVFSTIGFFDEKMHLYGEERDFAFRAWKQGIPSVNNNSITIFHKLSRSTIHNSSLKLYYYYRNFYYFIKKHKKNISRHSCLSWSFFLVNIKTMGSVIMHPSKYPDSTLKTLIALHWSILDGFIFTRMGKKHYQ